MKKVSRPLLIKQKSKFLIQMLILTQKLSYVMDLVGLLMGMDIGQNVRVARIVILASQRLVLLVADHQGL
jgi:hypothetical protein